MQVLLGNLWIRYAPMGTVVVGDGAQVAPTTVVGLEGSIGFSTGSAAA